MMISRLLFPVFLLILSPLRADTVFASDEKVSAYNHDRVGKLAGQALIRVCGDQTFTESRELLASLNGWLETGEEQPLKVVIREQKNFAGEEGLKARFRIGSRSCTLTLSPYQPNERAADELAYGISDAASKAFSDPDIPYKVEQSVTGLHRIDPDGEQFQQAFFLQWMQKEGVPSHSFFAVFDTSPETPRVILGKRRFNGHIIFGMADGSWERRRNRQGVNILARQSKDPVDTQTGGFNTIAISRNTRGGYSIKAYMPIGADSGYFRLKSSLGSMPVTGFDELLISVSQQDALLAKPLQVSELRSFPARKALLGKGLYPVYLELSPEAMTGLYGSEMFTLKLHRKGGSEIHLQVPSGDSLRKELREHLGFRPVTQ
jgi:hypothetical protein